jgi:hypothetical protein
MKGASPAFGVERVRLLQKDGMLLLEATSGNRLVRGVEHSLSGIIRLWLEADRYRAEWEREDEECLREYEIHPRLERYLDYFSDNPPEEQPSAPSS